MWSVMCGRSTYKLTWEEIVALYRLTLDQPARNTQARYNVCPTTTIDTIVGADGKRQLVPMRWGLVPSWWSKPLKELKLATFNARAETVTEKPFFREAFKRTRCLIPVSGYYEWESTPGGKAAVLFHGAGRVAGADNRRPMGRVAGQGERRNSTSQTPV
jgi:putative SOS response-associated peptidase YedK